MSCEECRFYEGFYKGSESGRCHRYAPRPHANDEEWSFPTTLAQDWCGEFEQRQTDAATTNSLTETSN